jgi:hypothetical protein
MPYCLVIKPALSGYINKRGLEQEQGNGKGREEEKRRMEREEDGGGIVQKKDGGVELESIETAGGDGDVAVGQFWDWCCSIFTGHQQRALTQQVIPTFLSCWSAEAGVSLSKA